ncbi:hypothetical protein ACFYXD_35235 [Streptomyces platensis]|uniref:hypothetical protein n=1 Tax=Streptomyces platensis TaxID=58346 RepID=UPI0036792A08
MRKRPSRPARFAAVDNKAIDTISSLLAVGVLTRLIRAKDGDDVTVETMAQDYDEGEKSLTKAMRILVNDAFVVKFKIQRAKSETISYDDGTEEIKRGGSWYTTFSVDSLAFTAEEVAEMVQEIYRAGNVKALRVEPEHLDPRKGTLKVPPSRPTPPKGGVGPTRENAGSANPAEDQDPENSGPRPTPPQAGVGGPTPGGPTPGDGGALYRKKTSSSLSDDVESGSTEPAATAGSETGEEREEPAAKDNDAPEQTEAGDDAVQVLAAYEEARGAKAVNGTRQSILAAAEELLAGGRPLSWLIDRARELPQYGTDLIKHAEMSKVPFTVKATRKAPTAREALGLDDPGYVPVQRDMGSLKAMIARKAGI